mgnify:CR=1 FL=1
MHYSSSNTKLFDNESIHDEMFILHDEQATLIFLANLQGWIESIKCSTISLVEKWIERESAILCVLFIGKNLEWQEFLTSTHNKIMLDFEPMDHYWPLRNNNKIYVSVVYFSWFHTRADKEEVRINSVCVGCPIMILAFGKRDPHKCCLGLID